MENWPLGRRGWPIARGVHQPPSRSTLRPRGPAPWDEWCHRPRRQVGAAGPGHGWRHAPGPANGQLTVAAACSMTSVTCLGCDIITTCDDRISIGVAPARSAMNRWVAGGIVRSSEATTYHDGMVSQAAGTGRLEQGSDIGRSLAGSHHVGDVTGQVGGEDLAEHRRVDVAVGAGRDAGRTTRLCGSARPLPGSSRSALRRCRRRPARRRRRRRVP